jgi:hypothetical protein
MWLIDRGAVGLARLLLESGADITAVDPETVSEKAQEKNQRRHMVCV